jgi:MFS family permease
LFGVTEKGMLMSSFTPRRVSPWLVFAITSLSIFAVMLDSLALLTAFPAIQRSFAAVSDAELSWVLNAYTIVYGALLAPSGALADRFGRKRMFLLGAGLFALASLLCGLAPDVGWLIGLRAMQAVGGALLSPAALALVLAAFPKTRQSAAVGLWGAIGALAVVTGPPLGAWVAQMFGWRGIFFLNLPVGLLAVVLGRRILGESRDHTRTVLPDLAGVALLCAGVGALTFGLVQSDVWGWRAPGTIGALLGGVIALGVFLARSRTATVPALDVSLFHDPSFRLANLANVLFGVAFTAFFAMAPANHDRVLARLDVRYSTYLESTDGFLLRFAVWSERVASVTDAGALNWATRCVPCAFWRATRQSAR